MSVDDQDEMREALKRTAVVLKESSIAFALGGGYAAWARGGPEPAHDVDFIVAEADAKQAQRALEDAELRVEQAPEDWLFKVFHGQAMVDILFRIAGSSVESPVLERAGEVEVLSIRMPVLSATDVIASKIKALTEHNCDYASVLPVARALREQVDWEQVRSEVGDNDFAVACLFLLDRLGITES